MSYNIYAITLFDSTYNVSDVRLRDGTVAANVSTLAALYQYATGTPLTAYAVEGNNLYVLCQPNSDITYEYYSQPSLPNDSTTVLIDNTLIDPLISAFRLNYLYTRNQQLNFNQKNSLNTLINNL